MAGVHDGGAPPPSPPPNIRSTYVSVLGPGLTVVSRVDGSTAKAQAAEVGRILATMGWARGTPRAVAAKAAELAVRLGRDAAGIIRAIARRAKRCGRSPSALFAWFLQHLAAIVRQPWCGYRRPLCPVPAELLPRSSLPWLKRSFAEGVRRVAEALTGRTVAAELERDEQAVAAALAKGRAAAAACREEIRAEESLLLARLAQYRARLVTANDPRQLDSDHPLRREPISAPRPALSEVRPLGALAAPRLTDAAVERILYGTSGGGA